MRQTKTPTRARQGVLNAIRAMCSPARYYKRHIEKKELHVEHLRSEERGIVADLKHLKAYQNLFDLPLNDDLPIVYPHLISFPHHLKILSHKDFPFPMMGLIHVSNTIVQMQPLRCTEPMDLVCEARNLREAASGLRFDLLSSIHTDGELRWKSISTFQHMKRTQNVPPPKAIEMTPPSPEHYGQLVSSWDVGSSTIRQYARCARDYNPIHLFDFAARSFGLKQSLAHGMYIKSRMIHELNIATDKDLCLHATFKKPAYLPLRASLRIRNTHNQRDASLLCNGELITTLQVRPSNTENSVAESPTLAQQGV